MKKLLLMNIAAILLISCSKKSDHRGDAKIESKIDSIISKLTLQEKIGQMSQIVSFYSTNPDGLKKLVKEGLAGSLINEVDPLIINELQKIAISESKHGIPLIIGRDVIHGFKTIFPIPLGQAASWNPQLIERSSHIAALEARSAGVTWTFSPMIDVSRDSRWGRVAEGYGEDPYLSSMLGSATIKGYQGNNLSSRDHIASCAKHFAAYGAVESGRDYNTVILSDQELRNVYLPPFKAAVDAGVASFMTSFNEVNGIPSSGNKLFLKDLLRKEWGFNGFVVSEWLSIPEMVNHGFAADACQSAMIAVNAGVDMEMVSSTFTDNLAHLLDQKRISIETIDNAVRNIIRIKLQPGLFENPYVDIAAKSVMANDSSLVLAKKLAEESMVLLKNSNHILPLNTNIGKLAVVGPMADDRYEQLGTWIFDGDTNLTVTPLKALKDLIGEHKIQYWKGLTHSRDKNTSDFESARSIASSSG